MDEQILGAIDIEGKKLVCSAKDVAQLSTPAGCQLKVVTDKVHKLYDDYDEDDEDVGGGGGDNNQEDSINMDDMVFDGNAQADEEGLDRKKREYRRKREFISLVLNANRDPVKPGSRSRFREYQEDELEAAAAAAAEGKAKDGGDEYDCLIRNLEWNNHVGIHRMYANMGNYADYLRANKFQEISPGRVYKLQRVPGVQLAVSEKELVIYNCAFWTEGSSEPFDSTWLRRTTITSHLEHDSILPGLHELLLTCTKGELCEAFFRPEVAFGRLGVPPRIPANATIFCLLEVVKVVSRDKFAAICARQQRIDTLGEGATTATTTTSADGSIQNLHSTTMMLQFGDLFEASDEARQRGNYFYQQGQYRIALQRYKSAIRLLEGLTYRDEKEEREAQGLLIKLYNNCARTANAMGAPRLALAACKQARLITDLDPKTHWHRMSAWQLKGHSDKALGVARRAIQLFEHHEPSAREFRKMADRLMVQVQKERREMDDLHRLMGRALTSSA